MGLQDFIDDHTPDEGEESSPEVDESEVKKDRIVRAEISLARHYENVTEEEAEELHREWVYDVAEEIEDHFDNVKITDWTALQCRIWVPGEDYPDPFWMKEE